MANSEPAAAPRRGFWRFIVEPHPSVPAAQRDDVRLLSAVLARFCLRVALIVQTFLTGRRELECVPLRAGLPPMRVLLAEDNVVNQTVALRMLERLGQHADVAANGQEAVEAALRTPYDVIFMDVQMPVLDGIEATRQIIERLGAKAPRIIAMTANALPGDREKYLAAGCSDYLTKPVRLDALEAALRGAPG